MQRRAMKSTPLERIKELACRRPLSAAEQAQLNDLLAADPSAWPERNEELALTALLNGLPDAPLASNFTARVMREIANLESTAARPPRWRWWSLRTWSGRMAWSTAVVAVSLVGWSQYRLQQRSEYVRSLTTIGEVAAVPSVEVLRDFDAIHTFARVPSAVEAEADVGLLAALQ